MIVIKPAAIQSGGSTLIAARALGTVGDGLAVRAAPSVHTTGATR